MRRRPRLTRAPRQRGHQNTVLSRALCLGLLLAVQGFLVDVASAAKETRRTKSRPDTPPAKRLQTKPTPPKKPRSKRRPKRKLFELIGTVQQRGTRDPIEGAPVYLLGRRKRFNKVTNAEGQFRFSNVPEGTYRLVIPVPNFKQYKRKVILKAPQDGKPLQVSYYLTKISSGLFESTTRVKKKQREVIKQTIAREELAIIPGTQGDPLKVVQNLPGVARTPLNTGFFIVRGSAPEDSRVFIDGHQIPQLYHFGGLTAVVNGDMAQSINLLPGGFSVANGRATGGIIQLQTRQASNRWHGYLDLDVIDVGFFLEGPLWKGASLIISARRSHLDAFLNLILPDSRAFDLTVAPRYYDYQVKLDWRVNKAHFLSLMIFGSDDLLTFLRDTPIGRSDIRGEFSLMSLFHRAQFLWRFNPTKTIAHDFSVHFGFAINDVDGGGVIRFANTEWVVSIRDELRVKIGKRLLIRAGADIRIRNINLDAKLPQFANNDDDTPGTGNPNPLTDLTEVKREYAVIEPALYLEADWQVVDPLRVIFGVRGDYADFTNDFTFNPRLSMVWTTPHKPLSFKGTIGLFSQPPQLQETSAEFGNPDLSPEHAMHYTLATTYQFTPYISASVTFYYKQMLNLIVNSSATVVRDGEEVPERFKNNGVGASYGMEVLLRHKPFGRFFGWLSYTLGRSERQDDPAKPPSLFAFDQTHIMTLVMAYKIGWGLTASLRFRLVSGNPTTPYVGSVYDADAGRYIPIPGEANSERVPLFHQLDLRLDYKITFTSWKLMFYLDIQNVYNHANQEGVTNNYDFSQQAPLTGLPILPSFGIKGEF